MKVWGALVNFIGVLMISFLLLIAQKIMILNDKDFEETRLKYAVDYASDAAFSVTLITDDIGVGYTDLSAVKINPSPCIDTFKALMCFSYNMALSDENFAMLNNYIPVMILATNDGYYIAKMIEVDNNKSDSVNGGEYELVWSIKKPYEIAVGNRYYAFNLNNNSWVSTYENAGVIMIETGTNLPVGITREEIQERISDLLTKEINLAIQERNSFLNDKNQNLFYLPSNLAEQGVNTIKSPTFLAIVQNVDFVTRYKIEATTVGGVGAVEKEVVVGFVKDGIKYYCYNTQIPQNEINLVDDIFSSVDAAARAGYFPNFDYLSKKRN